MNHPSIYVTSTIPYVNANPHVGFALELVQADVIARYHRQCGGDVRLQTGTDEHAFKNVAAARQAGIPTAEFVTAKANRFRTLANALNVSHDRFIRTTELAHRRAVEALWHRLRREDIYRARYTGHYCLGCEDFWLERDLVNGVCPDHGTAPEPVTEENYFFRLSAYARELEELLDSGRLAVVPTNRRNEVHQFIRGGLHDFSVSRSAARVGGWGIPIPGDTSQIFYVWIDALVNYLSGLGFGDDDGWTSRWSPESHKIHVIGKNVWKFHAVYWPALLLSAGLPVPDTVVVHGFLTQDGRKISKSRGDGVDPVQYVDAFGADTVRYFLLRHVRPFADSNFSLDGLHTAHVGLANGVGNLASRLTGLCERAGYRAFPIPSAAEAPEEYHNAFQRYEFDRAAEALEDAVRAVNRDIETAAPWSAIGQDARRDSLEEQLSTWLRGLHGIAYWLAPFIPDGSERVLAALAADPIRKIDPLFPRVR